MVPLVRPVSILPVSTHGRRLMRMMLMVVLAVMLVMLVMMLVVTVTMLGIKLHHEFVRRWP